MFAAPREIEHGYDSLKPIPWYAWGRLEDPMRVPDTITKTILFLGQMARGEFIPYGTAFITATYAGTDLAWQTVVTARHVIDRMGDVPFVYVRLNDKRGEAQVIRSERKAWFFHPDDRVDVAVFPSILPKDQFDIKHFPLTALNHQDIKNPDVSFVLSHRNIVENDIGIGDEVYFSGLFIGRIGDTANIPILRVGTIAAMSGEPIKTQYGFHEAFLIEARSIDGLSGSPVCVHLPPHRELPNNMGSVAAPIMKSAAAYLLMGMVLGYNEVYNPADAIEILKSKRPENKDEKISIPLNTGIAVVLPIWKIIEAVDQPIIKEKREALLKQSNQDKGRGFVATAARGVPLSSLPPAVTDANPDHREDFTRLLGAAATPKKSGD